MTDKPVIHIATREERMRDDFVSRLEEIEQQPLSLVEPSEDEKRNGWTAETLTAYLAERKAATSMALEPNSAIRRSPPQRANGKYNPHYWRRPRS